MQYQQSTCTNKTHITSTFNVLECTNAQLKKLIVQTTLSINTHSRTSHTYLPCRHEVVIVKHSHKRLDPCSLANSLLAHFLGDLERVAINTGHQRMPIKSVIATIVMCFNDNPFFPGVATTKDHHHLACFHNLHHG